ncbi:homeotic protein female sterile isoform X1 [Anastrepha ludens]|uniref:homeotic protein female sterile isoform X1 n=1 Tax=Anastrepha ludens TaxID=28586 RepID=UPI0023B1E045|nr:homeotic protein female sterile isoform X1 [Anastrepha ludens]
MDALSASSTFANTSDTNTSNNVTKTKASKESIVSTATSPPSSLRSTLDSSPLTSTDPIVIPAIIEPPSPARSSRASSCSAHSRLRVASTDSDTPGGEMSVSGGSQHGAALDMKIKASAVSVASVTAAAAAVELLQGGTPSSQTQSQKIKKCAFNTQNSQFSEIVDVNIKFSKYSSRVARAFEYDVVKTNNNSNNDNLKNVSIAIADSFEGQTVNSAIATTMVCPKLLRSCRSRGSPRLQQLYQQQEQQRKQKPVSLQRHQKQLQQQQRLQQQHSKRYRQQPKSKHLNKKFRLEQERKFAEAEQLQQQQQQQNASIKENFLLTLDLLAVVRRNASDKLRLIQMVHDNPILWDSRLPNFKGAEEEKNRAWEMIGKEFNAPGRRVARAFKSLRESYRRELAHVKLMGNGFKPKWSLYDAMDFLRDVIRERKGGSHAVEQAAIGLNLSAFSHHLSNNNNNNSKSALKLSALHSSFNESALNLSKCAPGLNMSHEDYYYYVKPELDMAAAHPGGNVIGIGGNTAVPSHPMPAHQAQQQQQQQHLHSAAHDSRVSSTRNDSATQHSTTFDDLDASSVRSGDEASVRNADMSNQGSDEVEELEAIDADFPYPLILDANSPRSMSAAGVNGGNAVVNGGASKRKRRELNGDTIDGTIDDEDDYEGQMLQQHRHLRQQNGGVGGGSGGGGGLGGASGYMLDIPPPQTVREVLNLKFCGFIAAKLNSMEDTEADNLMNKILMLLVQTQTSEGK